MPAHQKYRQTSRGLRASSVGEELGAGSLLVVERTARFYETVLPARVSGELADLGAGSSPLKPVYEPLAASSWGLDWPNSAHTGDIDVAADLNAGVPLRTCSMDTLLVADVLEHLADPAGFLRECRRILRPGGVLIGNVPFMYWLHEEPYDFFRYTEHGLRHLLEGAGFARADVRVLGGGLDVVVDILGKILAQVPLVGAVLARALQGAWGAVTSVSFIRRPMRRLERLVPLSYGFVVDG